MSPKGPTPRREMRYRQSQQQAHQAGRVLDLINIDVGVLVTWERSERNCLVQGYEDGYLKTLGMSEPAFNRAAKAKAVFA